MSFMTTGRERALLSLAARASDPIATIAAIVVAVALTAIPFSLSQLQTVIDCSLTSAVSSAGSEDGEASSVVILNDGAAMSRAGAVPPAG